jgi:SET domain-containing protein
MKNYDKATNLSLHACVTVISIYSFFNHSCSPNVSITSDKGARVELYAAEDIPKGSEALISYLLSEDLRLHIRARNKRMMPWLAQPCVCKNYAL